MMKDMNVPVLELQHISKRYGDRVLFHDFQLTVNRGDMICIAGPSGSGKSTILNIIGMFEQPDEGQVLLYGKPLPKADSRAGRELMRDHIFYLFQNFALVESETVDYNLEIPMMDMHLPKKEKERKKREALERVGLKTSLKEKIFHLSGGEQQRVAIARGYLKNFDLLLADEPTGSLDGKNRNEIIGILKDFKNDGKTVIIVSHDPVVMDHCERVIRIGS